MFAKQVTFPFHTPYGRPVSLSFTDCCGNPIEHHVEKISEVAFLKFNNQTRWVANDGSDTWDKLLAKPIWSKGENTMVPLDKYEVTLNVDDIKTKLIKAVPFDVCDDSYLIEELSDNVVSNEHDRGINYLNRLVRDLKGRLGDKFTNSNIRAKRINIWFNSTSLDKLRSLIETYNEFFSGMVFNLIYTGELTFVNLTFLEELGIKYTLALNHGQLIVNKVPTNLVIMHIYDPTRIDDISTILNNVRAIAVSDTALNKLCEKYKDGQFNLSEIMVHKCGTGTITIEKVMKTFPNLNVITPNGSINFNIPTPDLTVLSTENEYIMKHKIHKTVVTGCKKFPAMSLCPFYFRETDDIIEYYNLGQHMVLSELRDQLNGVRVTINLNPVNRKSAASAKPRD